MRELKFRAYDKKRNEYTTNFIIAPTSPTWGAFPIEHIDKKTKKYLCDGDYTLTDWSNVYGIIQYIVEQFIGCYDINKEEIY
jgi:hypothetical protein